VDQDRSAGSGASGEGAAARGAPAHEAAPADGRDDAARTLRGAPGSKAAVRSISSSRSTTRPARSPRRFWSRRKGRPRAFAGLIETIAAKGLFCSLSTDRGSHYFHTPEAGGKVAPGAVTQVGRALAQLGIEPIAAYSPEARGRSERAFRTLQDRLPKELALAGVKDVEAANTFIREV